MSVWMRVAVGVGIALMLGALVFAWTPGTSDPRYFAIPGWQAGEPSGYVKALGMLLLFTGMTANDGFAMLEGGWLALLFVKLPACMGWLLPPTDISLVLPYVHTAMGCWIVFFLWRHGDRFAYAAVGVLTMALFFVPEIGPVVQRWHGKVFSVRRSSEQPPDDSE